MNDYEQRQEARRARLQAAAEKREAEARARWDSTANRTLSAMGGEPVKIGHHSEGRHRRLIARADRDCRRALELHDEAKDLRHRAAAVGTGGISGEDPDAPVKLREKLEELERRRDHMKAVNAAWRKAGRPKPEDEAGVQRFADLAKISLGQAQAISAGIHRPGSGYHNKGPFLPYELTNLGARIRDTRARLDALFAESAARAVAPATASLASGIGWELIQDNEDNRLRLTFQERQPAEVVARVRAAGFLWSPTRRAWVRRITPAANLAADVLARWLRGRDTEVQA